MQTIPSSHDAPAPSLSHLEPSHPVLHGHPQALISGADLMRAAGALHQVTCRSQPGVKPTLLRQPPAPSVELTGPDIARTFSEMVLLLVTVACRAKAVSI